MCRCHSTWASHMTTLIGRSRRSELSGRWRGGLDRVILGVALIVEAYLELCLCSPWRLLVLWCCPRSYDHDSDLIVERTAESGGYELWFRCSIPALRKTAGGTSAARHASQVRPFRSRLRSLRVPISSSKRNTVSALTPNTPISASSAYVQHYPYHSLSRAVHSLIHLTCIVLCCACG